MKIIWVKDQKEEWLRQEGRQSVCPEQVPEEKEGQAECLPRAGPRGERRAGSLYPEQVPEEKKGSCGVCIATGCGHWAACPPERDAHFCFLILGRP